jgi:PA domain
MFYFILFYCVLRQVRNAQRSGAAGVIIADNTCLCSDQDCIAASGASTCETQEPIMADDGSGADISIPSFLMFKHDADLVKKELEGNRPVQIEMAWSLPSPDDRVEYDLWTTPTDVVSKDFLKSFKRVAQGLGHRAYFTPHMYIYDGVRSHCMGNSGENFCYNLCTNNGRYCATDPDNDLEKGISGADVVREALRRLCIWNMYGSVNGIGTEWWEYVAEFQDRCSKPEYFADPACIKDAYKHSHVDGTAVERCMLDSGGTDGDKTNSKLDFELKAQEQRGVVVIPTAFVNSAAIRGALNVNNIFQAVCSGFLQGTAPPACDVCKGCANAPTCIEKGYCPSGSSGGGGGGGGVSTSFFFFSMFLVIGGFAGLGIWHYKKTRDDMREQVRGILAEYMPLDDNDGGMMNGSPMDFARGGATSSLIS